jgi:uncharacterized protein
MKFANIAGMALFGLTISATASPLPDFPFITVTGEATMEVTPDQAKIQLMIRQTAAKADAATDAVYRQSHDLVTFLATQGVAVADIEAAQINKEALYKDYNDRSITGYEASQPVSIALAQLDNYVSIMDYLFKQPQIFSIQGSFDSSQREEYELQLSEQAGADAKRRANHLAGAQGVKISSVFAISETPGWGQLAGDFGFGGSAVSFGASHKSNDMAQSSSSLVLPRHIKLQKSVTVIYKIKP